MADTLMRSILLTTGICPILATAPEEDAVDAARAMVKGGLPVLEILIKNELSWKNIENVGKQVPELIMGAGTVLAKYPALDGLADSVVVIAEFDKDKPGIQTNHIIIAYDSERKQEGG